MENGMERKGKTYRNNHFSVGYRDITFEMEMLIGLDSRNHGQSYMQMKVEQQLESGFLLFSCCRAPQLDLNRLVVIPQASILPFPKRTWNQV